ncbi:putative Ig domain-containing protein, partial [Pelagicoccus sp. SDUM812003]|uniref:putative Ig domain-containing protein n=1 Tax=Pelagicoccus sp. SDUM812003 TaxID=3041267 RepID=UPI00280EE9F0
TLENGDPLPSWLSIDPTTGLLSGTPENADVGDIAVTVTATDASGATVSDIFGISVANTNDGPVATAIADQSIDRGEAFSLDVSSSFSDADPGDSLSYSATMANGDPLPEWLTIDPSTGMLSGTPAQSDSGIIEVSVTASDGTASASDTFTIDINDVVARYGDSSANTLSGDAYNDEISGGKGSDTIDGGAGDDLIYGDDSPNNSTANEGNYIINGSFEHVDGGENHSWGKKMSAVDGWTEANGKQFEMHIEGWDGMEAPTDGSYYLDMEESPGNIDISQQVNGLTDGASYTLSFDAADRVSDLGNHMEVYFGGELIATVDPQSEDSFQSYTFEVTGGMGDGSNTLRFVGYGSEDNRGILLDNVQLLDLQDDTIDAGAGNDTVFGGEGNDTIDAAEGDDTVDGGSGDDTLVLSGNRSDYQFTDNGDGTFTIVDTVADRDGTDLVSNIEYIQFADQTAAFSLAVNHAPTDIAFAQPNANQGVEAQVSNAYVSTGEGGGQASSTIDFSGANQGSGEIVIEFGRVDNSFEVQLNGQSLTGETIQLQANDYDPASEVFLRFQDGGDMSDPWSSSSSGDPRIKMVITEQGVEVWGLRTSSSTTYEQMELDEGAFAAPSINLGSNELTIINPDSVGADGLNATISGTYDTSPLVAIGLDESGNTTATLPENIAGAEIATLSSADPDAGDSGSYSIDSDPSGLFEIVGNTLKLKEGSSLDFENQSSHRVSIKVTDTNGATYTESITVRASDVDENASSSPADPDVTYVGTWETETITTGSGNDHITTGGGNDTVNAGDGNNTVIGSSASETITTGSGDDYIETNGGDDIVNAGDGNNTVVGTYGNETITTGAGDDTITASWGTDVINSGDGNDTIYAAAEEVDTIDAGAGDDTIIISEGYSFGSIDGGIGEDTLLLDGADKWIDFTNIGPANQLSNIERIDIHGSGSNHLKLSAEDVLDMTDGDNRLFVDGDGDDTVDLDPSFQSQGTENVDGTDYTHYYDATTDTHLYINNDITDQSPF